MVLFPGGALRNEAEVSDARIPFVRRGRARSYIDLTRHDQLIHRDVANAINGLTESLRLERNRVPGRILSEADRLECLLFGGFDPHFGGDEPPGL
jgi:hypothetical protein